MAIRTNAQMAKQIDSDLKKRNDALAAVSRNAGLSVNMNSLLGSNERAGASSVGPASVEITTKNIGQVFSKMAPHPPNRQQK